MAQGTSGWSPLRWFETIALVLTAAYALTFNLHLPSLQVGDTDYSAAAATIEREGQPGDVVFLYPWWTERARPFVAERFPVVGYLGAYSAPLQRHPRIWLLSQPRLPRSDLDEFMREFVIQEFGFHSLTVILSQPSLSAKAKGRCSRANGQRRARQGSRSTGHG